MSSGAAILGLYDQIKGRLYHSSKKIVIENWVFRLFSRFTVSALFLSAGLVTLQQLVGEHIKCILPPKDDIRPEALNQYCFIMSTYTLPHLYNVSLKVNTTGQSVLGYNQMPLENLPHFGVGPHNPEIHEQRYHSYYQWVPFVLFFQGIFFLVPHLLWKMWEDNRIKAYSHLELAPNIKMKDRELFEKTDSTTDALSKASECFKGYMYYNHFYSGFYIFCELLNFIIVVINIFLTDSFLGNEFTSYGPEVVNFMYADPETRIDPMSRVFPKVTKCDFRKYGPSGNIIPYDIMCVLPMNIINEKIYVFLWFWFVILAIIGGLNLIYRLITVLVPGFRNRMLLRNVPENARYEASLVCNRLSFADWFHLKRISDNLNGGRFGDLCKSLNHVLNGGDSSSSPQPSLKSRSGGSLISPPPTYDSSTLKITDTLDRGGNNGKHGSGDLFLRNKQYPSLDGHEAEPLVDS